MLRALRYFIIVGLMVAAAIWLAERPGHVALTWQGWAIETNMIVLAVAMLLLTGILLALVRVIGSIRGAPAAFSRWREERKHRRGQVALTRGLVAVAAGDAGSARKLAREAGEFLGEDPLARLLAAQAAHLAGDFEAARCGFTALVDDRETAFLALRGLIALAEKENDKAAALAWTRQAYAIRPDAKWVAETMFGLEVGAGQWREAQSTLEEALSDAPGAKRRKAALLHKRAEAAMKAGESKEAIELARRSVEADPTLVPAVLLLAGLENARGKRNRAAEMLEEGWRFAPQPEIAKAYLALWPEESPVQLVSRAERLAGFAAGHPESGLVLGEAALAARLWGRAREALAPYMAATQPDARLLRLMAGIERDEKGDEAAALKWLARLGEAEADPAWICGSCGFLAAQWSPACPHCGEFAAFAWRRPSRGIVSA